VRVLFLQIAAFLLCSHMRGDDERELGRRELWYLFLQGL
jgi:hypothetical protein